MALTEHKFDPEQISALVTQRAANLKDNRGFSDLLGFGLGVIVGRLAKDRRRYRDYGPYWPALKLVLKERGHDFGPSGDPMIAAEYRGRTSVETMIMADEFRTEYLATQFLYSNQFLLDPDTGAFWTLWDDDMEQPQSN